MSFGPDATNPYHAPSSPIGPAVATTADPAVVDLRRHHLRHERAIRTMGLLMYALAGIAVVVLFDSFPRPGRRGASVAYRVGYGSAAMLLIACLIKLGRDLRRLLGWTRWFILGASVAALTAMVAALFVQAWVSADPERVGTSIAAGLFPALISIYFVYLVGSTRGGVVCSARYRAAVEATPELTARTSLLFRLAVGLLMLYAAIALLARLVAFFR